MTSKGTTAIYVDGEHVVDVVTSGADRRIDIPKLLVYPSIGVYNNHERVYNGVASEHIVHHIRYNLCYRPGRALFVNGVCINKGYLSETECENMINELQTNPYTPTEASYKYS